MEIEETVKIEIGRDTTGKWWWYVYRRENGSWRGIVSATGFSNRDTAKNDFKAFRDNINKCSIEMRV